MDEISVSPDAKERKRAYKHAYYLAHKEQAREYNKKNTERIREYQRAYRLVNAEKLSQQHHEYNERNREQIRERRREYWPKYYSENREKLLHQWRDNREINAKRAKNYKRDPSATKNTKERWRAKNKEKVLAYGAVAYAIKVGRLVRPESCQVCNNTGRLYAHHHLGYARENRLNVQWLCVLCHEDQHHYENEM